MLHVVLDTSAYRSNPRRNSPPFRSLSSLARAGKLKIYIPHLVKREFLSQQYEQIEMALKGLKGHANDLHRTSASARLKKLAESTLASVAAEAPRIIAAADREFKAWQRDVQAEEIPISTTHAQGAFADYFAGIAPYKVAKSRQDIPDGFIWRCVVALAEQKGVVHFIVEDEALRSSADSAASVTAYRKLDEFIQTVDVQDALRDLSRSTFATANLARLTELLPSYEEIFHEQMDGLIVDALAGRKVIDDEIPDDNREGTVTMVGGASQTTFDFENVEYFSDEEIGVRFQLVTECTLNYAIFKADFYLLDEDKQEKISIDERNDHYYDADEEYTLRVRGLLTSKLDINLLSDGDMGEEELRNLVGVADYNIDLDDVTVE